MKKQSLYVIVALLISFVCSSQWNQLQISGNSPSPRSGHSLLPLGNQKFLLFGGCSSSCCWAPLNDVWILDVAGANWTNINIQNPQPQGRVYHSADVTFGIDSTNSFMYIFGGSDSHGYFGDFWALNLGTFEWTNITSTTGTWPAARGAHSMTINSQYVVVFGGVSNDESVLGDTWVFDTIASAWYQITKSQGPSGSEIEATILIKARVASTMASSWGSIFLFGGQSASGEILNDLWVLQTDSFTWTQLGDKKSLISGRYGHVMRSSDYGLWVFGGSNGKISLNDAWEFDFTSDSWKIYNTTSSPIARTYSACSIYSNSNVGEPGSVIFGGFNFATQKLFGDVWLFSV